jgi:hypothetical protein
MNKRSILTHAAVIGVGLALSAPREASAQAVWSSVRGCATSTAGTWVIGCDAWINGGRGIYQFDFESHTFERRPGQAVDITIGGGGPWVVNDQGHIFKWDGTTFPEFVGDACDASGGNPTPVCARHEPGVSTIAVGSDATQAWMLDCQAIGNNFSIRHWNGNCWQLLPGLATQVTVDQDGAPWVINDAGGIFQLVGGVWQQRAGFAKSIGGGPFVIGSDDNLYFWNGSFFEPQGGKPNGVTPKQIFAETEIDTNGTIWEVSFIK